MLTKIKSFIVNMHNFVHTHQVGQTLNVQGKVNTIAKTKTNKKVFVTRVTLANTILEDCKSFRSPSVDFKFLEHGQDTLVFAIVAGQQFTIAMVKKDNYIAKLDWNDFLDAVKIAMTQLQLL